MIDFGDGVEVLAIWFVNIGGRGDWLAVVSKNEKEDPRWRLRYRFRWYRDHHKAFDSDDVKSWYGAWIADDDPSDEILAKVDLVAQQVAVPNRSTVDRVLVRGDGRKALELMSKRPWAHVRREPIS